MFFSQKVQLEMKFLFQSKSLNFTRLKFGYLIFKRGAGKVRLDPQNIKGMFWF